MTFATYTERWERDILPLKKASTVATMASHLRLLREAFGPTQVGRLDFAQVQTFFSNLSKTAHPKTVKNVWGTMRLVLAQAQTEGILKQMPKPVLPKVRREKRSWISLDQLASIIRTDPERKALWWLLYETGARIGEVLALSVLDVNFSDFEVSISKTLYNGVVQTTPKTDFSTRTISISPQLHTALAEYLGERKAGFLFENRNGNPTAANDLLVRRWHPVLASLGLPKTGFHALRRGSVSTALSVLEIPQTVIQHRVGHSGTSVTEQAYSQVVDSADRKAAEKMGQAIFDKLNTQE